MFERFYSSAEAAVDEVHRRLNAISNTPLCLASGQNELGMHWVCDQQAVNRILPGYCSRHRPKLTDHPLDRARTPEWAAVCAKCKRLKLEDCVCNIGFCKLPTCGQAREQGAWCTQHAPNKPPPTWPRLSMEDKHKLWSQSNCDLCSCEVVDKGQIDHDHTCCGARKYCKRCIRGVLCVGCNTRLVAGYERLPSVFRDSPRLNTYLERRLFSEEKENLQK